MQSVFSAVAVNGYREYAQQRHNAEEKTRLLTVCGTLRQTMMAHYLLKCLEEVKT